MGPIGESDPSFHFVTILLACERIPLVDVYRYERERLTRLGNAFK